MEQSKFYQIKNVTEHEYTLVGCDGSVITRPIQDVDRLASAFTIQDAKDGDVLADNVGVILFKSIRDNDVINYYAYLSGLFGVQKGENYWGYVLNCKLSPATKEQRERFFAAMHDAGYEWDAEKKELKKIENEIEIPFGAKDSELQEATYFIPKGFHAEIDDDKVVIKKGEKPTAWSREDEERLQSCLNILQAKGLMGVTDTVNSKWLKSLKNRVQSQPKQEENKRNLGGISSNWSEEDEKLTNRIEAWLDTLCDYLKDSSPECVEDVKDVMEQLKSLKGRVGCEANCTTTKEWREEDEQHIDSLLKRLDGLCRNEFERTRFAISEDRDWLESLKQKYTWKPSDKQMEALKEACDEHWEPDGLDPLYTLYQELKKLRGE